MGKSNYDPNRNTVGQIYREAQLANKGNDVILNGDMTHEMCKSLVDDLNETIVAGTKELEGRTFYITVHEKKDLQMKNCLLRRMIKTEYRPWPEDDTVVFKVIPRESDVRFCWCIPHHSEMDNMLANEWLYDKEMIYMLKCWKSFDLHNFGFIKDENGNWIANNNFQDKKLEKEKPRILIPSLI